MFKKFLTFLLLLALNLTFSQTTFSAGFLPQITTSIKLNSKLKLSNSIAAREIIYDDDFQFSHNLVDVTSILSVKTALNNTLHLGFVLRFKGDDFIYRSLQYYNIIQQLEFGKLAHRLGFEQFFEDQIEFRSRYRLTFQKALNGEKIDNKEWYLKVGNEYLWQFTNQSLEIRLAPNLGYKLNVTNKIEFGVDYRVSDFSTSIDSHTLWTRCTWYLTL